MYSHMGNRYSTIQLLLDWITFFSVGQRLRPRHKAGDIAYLVTRSGCPTGF
jgi:hypothetical protein